MRDTAVTFDGTLWVARCPECDWVYLAVAEDYALEELGYHQEDEHSTS